eukprot:COSAG01_NODE_497_length_16267_cov_5.357558_7_plen_67_part_00
MKQPESEPYVAGNGKSPAYSATLTQKVWCQPAMQTTGVSCQPDAPGASCRRRRERLAPHLPVLVPF